MKVLLVQLPVPNNRFINLPLALGYLKSAVDAARLPGVEVDLLEATAQDRGGDAYLIKAILAHSPDIIGFSLYTWNSTRTLELAHTLKQLAPELLILGGGPEVNRDNPFILSAQAFDYLVFGEGERTFLELLQNLTTSTPPLDKIAGLGYRPKVEKKPRLPLSGMPTFGLSINPPRTAIEDVNLVPSAYLNGTLDSHLGKFMFIELSRWCPSKCTFCYYGRQDIPLGGKRYFDLTRIKAELEYGLAHGVEQVHFVEANFNTLPHLSQIYRTIQETGANRQMRFYAEMRGEAIDAAEAERLAECNFGIIEVGLQSAVPEVLAKVRRKNNLPRLVEGVRHLRERGIEVFLDAILGLPGDTPATFSRTIDFIEQNQLNPYDIFHLQVLGGTQLKAEILEGQHGIQFQATPPYFVLQTADLSFEQLCQLRTQALKNKGEDPSEIQGLPQPSPFALATSPAANADTALPVERVIVEANTTTGQLEDISRQLQNEVTVWLKAGTNPVETLQILSTPNPTAAWHIFVESNSEVIPTSGICSIAQAVTHHNGYLDNLAVFALHQPDPAKFPFPPSIKIFNLVEWQPDLAGNQHTVWQVTLDATETAENWHTKLVQAANTPGAGLYVVTPPETPLDKIQAVLAGFEAGNKRLWFSDWTIAAGILPDNNPNDFPISWQQGQTGQVTKAAIDKARLRWELAKRRTPSRH